MGLQCCGSGFTRQRRRQKSQGWLPAPIRRLPGLRVQGSSINSQVLDVATSLNMVGGSGGGWGVGGGQPVPVCPVPGQGEGEGRRGSREGSFRGAPTLLSSTSTRAPPPLQSPLQSPPPPPPLQSPLLHHHHPAQVENISLLGTARDNGFVGVNMYVDDEGSIRGLPRNLRASEVAHCCGRPLEVWARRYGMGGLRACRRGVGGP